jgi:type 1 fimbria pilin
MLTSSLRIRAFAPAFVLAALAFGWTASAYGDCPTTDLPITFVYGSVGVSNSLAVGDVIPGTVKTFKLAGKCSAGLANLPVVACPAGPTAVAGMSGVYTTDRAGIGMRMRTASGTPLVGTGSCSTTSSLGNTAVDGSFNLSGTFELVKIASISAGTITTAIYNTGILNTGVTLNGGANRIGVAIDTTVRPVSCTVTSTTANQTIPLATVSPAMLASAGAVIAKTPFSIDLLCDAGVKVAATFTSASGNSGVASVLASTGTATGIGVQLLDASQTPIVLDTPRQLTSGTTGNMSFPFYGQYYRLGAAPVTAGSVKAQAVFTMSYQ